jgi:hypothetical protein
MDGFSKQAGDEIELGIRRWGTSCAPPNTLCWQEAAGCAVRFPRDHTRYSIHSSDICPPISKDGIQHRHRNTDDLSRFDCGSCARESFVLTTTQEARRSLPRNGTRRLKGVTDATFGRCQRWEVDQRSACSVRVNLKFRLHQLSGRDANPLVRHRVSRPDYEPDCISTS